MSENSVIADAMIDLDIVHNPTIEAVENKVRESLTKAAEKYDRQVFGEGADSGIKDFLLNELGLE